MMSKLEEIVDIWYFESFWKVLYPLLSNHSELSSGFGNVESIFYTAYLYLLESDSLSHHPSFSAIFEDSSPH